MTNLKTENRVVWVDWMRVAACFMVLLVHSTEPFYLGGQGSQILTEADAFWASFFYRDPWAVRAALFAAWLCFCL